MYQTTSANHTQQLAGKPIFKYQRELWTDENNTLWTVYYTADKPDDVWVVGFGIGEHVIEATLFSSIFRDLAESEIKDKLMSAADVGDYRDTDRYRNECAFQHAQGRI